jgi:threonine/homoserine/homoserine lactone efflux protein
VFGIEHYGAFVVACVVMNLTPGADTLYILTRSVAQGRCAGLWSALGISAGCLVHTTLAALGLSLILATSAWAFTAVKVVGGGYLIWLGLTALFGRRRSFSVDGTPQAQDKASKLFFQGLATNVLNPKVVLFFLAFLPPFVDPAAGGPLSFLVLGLTFFTTGTLYCLGLVLVSSGFTTFLRRRPGAAGWLNRGSGAVFVALGALVLTAEHR